MEGFGKIQNDFEDRLLADRGINHGVVNGAVEFLPGSQTDHPAQGQLLDGEVVPRLDQLLLPGLELDLGAQGVDLRRSAGSHLVCGLIVERLACLDLRFCGFNAGCVGDGSQITVAPRPAQPDRERPSRYKWWI